MLFAGLVDPRDLGDGSGRFGVERLWFGEFSWEELLPLRSLLDKRLRNGDAWMKAMLHWTGGHPFFTQWCCERLLRDSEVVESSPPKVVEGLIQQGLLGGDSGQPHQLLAEMGSEFIRCVTKTTDRLDLLEAYQSILDGVDLELNWDELAHRWLRVLGFVRVERIGSAEYLRVRNRLVEARYNLNWVRRSFAEVHRPYVSEIAEWRPGEKADTFEALTLTALEDRIAYLAAGEAFISKKEGRYLLALREEQGRRRAGRRRWIAAFLSIFITTLGVYAKVKLDDEIQIATANAALAGTRVGFDFALAGVADAGVSRGLTAMEQAIFATRAVTEKPLEVSSERVFFTQLQHRSILQGIGALETALNLTRREGDRLVVAVSTCRIEVERVSDTLAQHTQQAQRELLQRTRERDIARNQHLACIRERNDFERRWYSTQSDLSLRSNELAESQRRLADVQTQLQALQNRLNGY